MLSVLNRWSSLITKARSSLRIRGGSRDSALSDLDVCLRINNYKKCPKDIKKM